METLLEKIANRIIAGKGQFKTTTAALRAKERDNDTMELDLGADELEVAMRFSARSGRVATYVVQLAGAMVSDIVGCLVEFAALLGEDGEFEVVVSGWDDEVDWAAVYRPYEGPDMWNGRPDSEEEMLALWVGEAVPVWLF